MGLGGLGGGGGGGGDDDDVAEEGAVGSAEGELVELQAAERKEIRTGTKGRKARCRGRRRGEEGGDELALYGRKRVSAQLSQAGSTEGSGGGALKSRLDEGVERKTNLSCHASSQHR